VSITTAIAIFFILWWLSLFLVLPWGVRSQHEEGEISPGTEPGAPALPRIAVKLIWTTAIAAVLFLALSGVYLYMPISLASVDRLFGF
jgi:predicted secreted protein